MADVELDAVGLVVDGATILRDVSLEADVTTLAVIGRNGSGKSTLLRVIDGLARATSGRARVLGLDAWEERRRLHERVGFVFTNPDAQIVMPTVAEDVAFSLGPLHLGAKEAGRRVASTLESLGLDRLADVPAHSLSGGQKQLLAIASAVVRDPELVLADEPTTMLDLPNALRIGRLLLGGLRRPLVVATHDLALAAGCDEAVLMEGGTIVDRGPAPRVVDAYRARWE
ncbi:energy-coupling factor ABC transporter ATP-binding protein [Olsenella sp. oral taxon 809]|uniref:energy-coupling factor ABC transporter ATP-binding protein n=1 Tax=Olsenella sp. oral taxon 809 TaxID=661086 RepID=UPI000231EDE4|nr:ABC transporter ATP-binding protein [Olsenella sp. oral taxon 809]EHF01956.1 hypothetical protein HMPREF1008_01051 [Olsenella sp. oral taxon 809 str. F0356]